MEEVIKLKDDEYQDWKDRTVKADDFESLIHFLTVHIKRPALKQKFKMRPFIKKFNKSLTLNPKAPSKEASPGSKGKVLVIDDLPQCLK